MIETMQQAEEAKKQSILELQNAEAKKQQELEAKIEKMEET
jgi:hypothetical protein